jgi:protein gp37
MADTSIEWATKVWNPTTGCDRVSAGCDHCYALTMARRLKGMGSAKYQNDGDPRTSGPGFGLTVHPDTLTVPLRWRQPERVFVNSMSDLFHARVPVPFLAQVFAVMARTPQHTYQVLTKRPERLRAIVGADGRRLIAAATEADALALEQRWPLPNVHLGTSIELDRYTRRADDLRRADAVVRFLSLEPLLGPLPSLRLHGISWCIIGGESGPGARPLDLGWVRDLIARCLDAGTAVFVKQLGTVWAREHGSGSRKGGDWDSWPPDLRIREYPGAS